ncbi:hypothetical protein [Phytohabitans rumicis]|uniref:hypothetical protein n=1 Tax=Phytohabitans rumicis TaxID=1076125 RepID=UPI0031EB552D
MSARRPPARDGIQPATAGAALPPALRTLPGATEAELHARIERYLSWAGLVWGAGPNPPYRTSVAGFPVRLSPRRKAVAVVVPVAHDVRPEELTDAQAPALAGAGGALLRLVPAVAGWNLVATTVVPAEPLHLVDLDHAVKTTVARAMAAPALGGRPARDGPPAALPPVRRDTGDPLLDPTKERDFQRVVASLEALDVPVDRYQWGPGIAHVASGPLLVRLDAGRSVPVLSIDLLLGGVDPAMATAANVRRLLSPPNAAGRLALRRGGDGLYLTRCAEVVFCETAHGNLRAVLADLYAAGPTTTPVVPPP